MMYFVIEYSKCVMFWFYIKYKFEKLLTKYEMHMFVLSACWKTAMSYSIKYSLLVKTTCVFIFQISDKQNFKEAV